MSISSPVKQQLYVTFRLLKVHNDSIEDILHKQKKVNKGWTQTRVLNMAMALFKRSLAGGMSANELQDLYDEYDAMLDKQNKKLSEQTEFIKVAERKSNRYRYAKPQ